MAKKRKDRRAVKISGKLRDFLKDESGSMSRENILKIGIATIAALGSFVGTIKAADVSGTQDSGEASMGTTPMPGTSFNHMVHTNADVIKWRVVGSQKELYPSHVHHAVHEAY